MNAAKVSIVMPAYNTAPYIERALDSIRRIRGVPYEAWLIDDGSTDRTLCLLQEFAAQNGDIHVLSQTHAGAARARNEGLRRAEGAYIYFMDSDDYVEPDGLADMVREITQGNADVVVSGIYEEAMGAAAEMRYPACRFDTREEYLRQAVALWDTHLPYTMGNKLYRADFLRQHQILFPETCAFGEDTRFNMQVFAAAQRISVLEKSYYHYIRERPGSTTTRYKPDLFEIRIRENRMFWEYFEQQELLTEQGIEYLSRRHAERLAGCVVNLFLPDSHMSARQKLREIERICKDPDTKQALLSAKLRSKKMKLLLWPVRREWCGLGFLFGAGAAFVQTHLPGLFLRLKAKR